MTQQQPSEAHDLLTITEAADLLRAPVATLRYWRHLGTGPRSFRLGRRVVYRTDDLHAWIALQHDTDAVTSGSSTVGHHHSGRRSSLQGHQTGHQHEESASWAVDLAQAVAEGRTPGRCVWIDSNAVATINYAVEADRGRQRLQRQGFSEPDTRILRSRVRVVDHPGGHRAAVCSRRQSAIDRQDSTNATSFVAATDQPTIAREKRSIANATQANPDQVATQVKSVTHASVGDAYDNAVAQSLIGLFKNKAIAAGSPFRTGPLRTLADVEALTMNYVDWYNSHRLHSLLDLVTPEEFEQRYYDHNTGSPTGDAANTKTA